MRLRTGSDTKRNLLKITRDLIDRKGIDEISMRTVGKAARLSRCALYRHFDGKESLLAAIAIENFEILTARFDELERNIKDPRQLLFELGIAYYDFGIHNAGHYRLMFTTKWDEGKYPDVKEAAVGVFDKVALYVSRALKTKRVNSKIVLEKTAILYAFIHGLVELHLAGHDEAEKGLADITSLTHSALESILAG